MALNYRIFSEFMTLYLTAPYSRPFDQETPTIARALRHLIDTNNPLVQLFPALLGVLWSTWYWYKHKYNWNWLHKLPLLLLVSVTTNFFAWSCDQVILLPALLQGTVWCLKAASRIAVILYVVTELAVLLVKFFTPHDFWYFWLAGVRCSIYLYTRTTVPREMSGGP